MNQTFLVMQLSANDDSLARREKRKAGGSLQRFNSLSQRFVFLNVKWKGHSRDGNTSHCPAQVQQDRNAA
jgi:hypothetical protein